MKTKLLFAFGVILILMTTIISKSCKEEDPCEGINCLNGGACINGKCECPESYYGEFCENKEIFSGQINFTLRISNLDYDYPHRVTIDVKGSSNIELSGFGPRNSSGWTWDWDCIADCYSTSSTWQNDFTAGEKGLAVSENIFPDRILKPGVYVLELSFTDKDGDIILEETIETIGGQAIRVEENETTQLARIDITLQ